MAHYSDTSVRTDSHVATTRGAAPCQARVLHGRGGREGENGGAHGDVFITNTGASACVLDGAPRLQLIRADGSALAVRQVSAAGLASSSVVLPAGKRDAAWLIVYWSNWCGGRPGPLRLRITLPGTGGAFVVPFDGQPNYNYVPDCTDRAQAATIAVLSAYGQGPGF